VTFFVGELAMGPAIELSEKWSIGVMLRLPVASHSADLYQVRTFFLSAQLTYRY